MGFYLSEVCSPRELRVSLEMVAIAGTETSGWLTEQKYCFDFIGFCRRFS
jgi:hypothetical protein